MSRKIKLMKDYYDKDSFLYKKDSIELKPGVTVLVGCNGIGKTTLLKQIEHHLIMKNIPYVSYDNLHEGGSKSISRECFNNNFEFVATAMCSSEGENIVMNLGKLASRLGNFVRTGEDYKNSLFNKFAESLKETDKEVKAPVKIPKERWILLDAIDSGLSIDNIIDLKELLFKMILECNFGNKIYIVVVANEYEMARSEQCFDVYNGEYIEFKNYEDYRDFVIRSKEWKENR